MYFYMMFTEFKNNLTSAWEIDPNKSYSDFFIVKTSCSASLKCKAHLMTEIIQINRVLRHT